MPRCYSALYTFITEATRGTIEVGKVGDLAVWGCGDLVELSYYLGLNQLVGVYKNGVLVGTGVNGNGNKL